MVRGDLLKDQYLDKDIHHQTNCSGWWCGRPHRALHLSETNSATFRPHQLYKWLLLLGYAMPLCYTLGFPTLWKQRSLRDDFAISRPKVTSAECTDWSKRGKTLLSSKQFQRMHLSRLPICAGLRTPHALDQPSSRLFLFPVHITRMWIPGWHLRIYFSLSLFEFQLKHDWSLRTTTCQTPPHDVHNM